MYRFLLDELLLELNVNGRLATLIVESARVTALDVHELVSLLPRELTLRVRAGAVAYTVSGGPSVAVYGKDGSVLVDRMWAAVGASPTRPPLRLLDVGGRDDLPVFQLATTPTGASLLISPTDFARTRFGSSRPKSAANIPRRFPAVKSPSRSAALSPVCLRELTSSASASLPTNRLLPNSILAPFVSTF